MEQIELQRSEPVWLPLPPRVLCEKCVHRASVIFNHHPLCGDCFLEVSERRRPGGWTSGVSPQAGGGEDAAKSAGGDAGAPG